jgi:hypothetical protein
LYTNKNVNFFSFIKSENRKVEQVLPGEDGTNGKGEEEGKGCERVDIVQILCTPVCKWKNESC